MPNGSFTKVTSNNTSDVAEGIKGFDALSDSVIKKASKSGAVKTSGNKKFYWIPGKKRPNMGITVIEYNGKRQTMMPMNTKQWDKIK